MKKYLFLIPLLTACTTKAMMNQSCYTSVDIGESILDVEKSCGKPYTVHSNGGNADVYEYIERITFGQEVIETRRYFLLVSNGKVVGKYLKYSNPPGVLDGMYPDSPYPNY
ncbi:MAG: hypothetical protein P0S94_00455 [Simkaniaceae bacterium]|nr:hypothetical protein [Simkaniaceae bacterium]